VWEKATFQVEVNLVKFGGKNVKYETNRKNNKKNIRTYHIITELSLAQQKFYA
jgi:hypothetical protein